MAIVDQFGRPSTISSRFAHAADRSTVRGPQFPVRSCSIEQLIPPRDRITLVSLSQRLYTNKGVVRGAVDQKAEYSVGDAYLPQYGGVDVAAGDEAENWLNNVWYPNCDVRGGVYDFNQNLIQTSIAIDREGEAFILLTETNEGGFPLMQVIPSFRIRSGHVHGTDEVKEGDFKGARIHDGIISNSRGRAIAYRVYTGDDNRIGVASEDFDDIPAASMIHVFNPRYQEQGRGLPAFIHALDDLKHCLQSTEDERRRQGILSGLGLTVTNESGGPDLSDPSYDVDSSGNGNGNGTGNVYENTNGIYYLTANAGEKLEQIKHESPGDIWEGFHDRMIREAIAGVGWSYSLAWKPTGQGTAERGEILRARRSVQARQKLITFVARRLTTYATAYAIEQGLVPKLSAPLSWGFTKPPRLTVDDGREAKALAEGYRMGSVNLTPILEGEGITLEGHNAQRINEIVKRKNDIVEGNKRLLPGATPITDRDMVMLTPNEVAAETTEEPTNPDE